MPKVTLTAKNGYELLHDPETKTIELVKIADPTILLMTARFFYDTSDGATVLSDFQNKTKEKGLAKLIADMVSDYLSSDKDKCKLFCYAGTFETEFSESKDYRTTNIDRLMLREKPKVLDEAVSLPSGIEVSRLHSNPSPEIVKQMTTLLKQHTYWGKDADEHYMQSAACNSECFLATDQQKNITGFVRYISNQNMAYISDMVVHPEWRNKKIGAALMQQACRTIDDRKHEFTALISAREGDGQAAAPKLYGDKFGFKDYAQEHQHKIYFRYVSLGNMVKETLISYCSSASPTLFSGTNKPQEESAKVGERLANLVCGYALTR